MIFIYFFLTSFLFLVLFPFLVIFFKNEMPLRLGFQVPLKRNTLWFHAASVGEINALKPLILKTQSFYPNQPIVISVTSHTGLETAAKISSRITVFIYPFDVFFLIEKVFQQLQPKCIVLMETEWWPCMLHFAKEKKVPVIMVNARLTIKSVRRYKQTKLFWNPLWKAITVIGAQSEENKQRFEKLGFKDVKITNNLKFHANYPTFPSDIRKQWHLADEDFVIVWGSSRPGEEALLQSILPDLKKSIKNLKVIVCPRHLTRLPEVRSLFPEHVLHSKMNGKYEIVIIDKMGVLLEAYSFCDIAIVGGSFFDFGGHNPLEPAFYSKAIIMGKYHSSCKESVEMLIKNEAIIISEETTLKNDIVNLYKQKDKINELGNNAKDVMINNSNSLEKNFNLIQPFVEEL